jgi:hypothetical protein
VQELLYCECTRNRLGYLWTLEKEKRGAGGTRKGKGCVSLTFFDSYLLPYLSLLQASHIVPRILYLLFFSSSSSLRLSLCCFYESMDLDSSGLASTIPSDPSDTKYTLNPSHCQFFNQSASLVMDRMQDMQTTPGSSPMVSAQTTICASKSFFFSERVVFPSGTSTQSRIRRAIAGQWERCIPSVSTCRRTPETKDP